MDTQRIIADWTRCLREELLPGWHGHLHKALASLSLGMALARSCNSSLIALHVPGEAKPASARRRLERLWCNEHLEAFPAMRQVAQRLLEGWPTRQILLTLDETPNANELRAMKLSVGWHRRVVPLLSVCYRPDAPPQHLPELVVTLVEDLAGRIPEGVEVTLLADRGLCWPVLVRACKRVGWHYVLRAQQQCRFRDGSGERALKDLVSARAEQFYGSGEVFKDAGWEGANVVAVWEEKAKEPWLLITDQRASYQRCRNYCRRTWCEETYRDEKSSGWRWQDSCVTEPEHAGRLIVLMQLAMLLAVTLGAQMLRRGYRKALDPHRQRRLSIFQLGDRWLIWCLAHAHPLCCPLGRLPP